MEKIKIVVQIIFSIAIIYFATSIILLTVELSKIREEVPNILSSIEKIERDAKIDSILETADLGIKEIEKLRELTPLILKQVDNTNKNIPVILEEVKQTREAIPAILTESKNIRASIPPILEESKAIRKDVPIQLDKVEKITKNIDQISKDVASGAVSGTVTGIISLPKDIVKKTADTLTGKEEPK